MIIGIDLGTTNSLACAWVEEKPVLIPNEFGEYFTPSVVSVEEDTILVGKVAKQRLVSHPNETIASFKRFMGENKTISLGNETFTPPELSSLIIRSLIKDAEKFLKTKIDEIIISVPAYFDNRQRYATKLAGQLAGVKVERIINEPTAASLRHGKLKSEDKISLVFDFGGGTLDVSIVEMFENVIEVIAINGDNHLGGNDINNELLYEFMSEFNITSLDDKDKAMVLRRIDNMKASIHDEPICETFLVKEKEYVFSLDNIKVIKACADIFEKIKKTIMRVLISADITLDEINEFIMVGGSSKMKAVQKYMGILTKCKIYVEEDCDYSVALGCGTIAGIKMRKEIIKDLVLSDVCPFSLGVGTHNNQNVAKLIFSSIIDKNSVLPTSKVDRFYSIVDNQKKVLFKIYQGEKMYAEENRCIGEIVCDIPANKAGEESIDVRFSYDINGILEVDATVNSNQKKFNKLIIDRENELTKQEIENKVSILSKMKKHPKEEQENKLVVAIGERLFQEVSKENKEAIQSSVLYFERILQDQEVGKIRRKRNQLMNFYKQVEQELENYGFKSDLSINECINKIINDLEEDEEEDEELYEKNNMGYS